MAKRSDDTDAERKTGAQFMQATTEAGEFVTDSVASGPDNAGELQP
jgi:hypothetical protein